MTIALQVEGFGAVHVSIGTSLRDGLKAANLPLDGHCDGAVNCASCAVRRIGDWSGFSEPQTEAEADMLDVLPPASRLSCQLIASPTMNNKALALLKTVPDLY